MQTGEFEELVIKGYEDNAIKIYLYVVGRGYTPQSMVFGVCNIKDILLCIICQALKGT